MAGGGKRFRGQNRKPSRDWDQDQDRDWDQDQDRDWDKDQDRDWDQDKDQFQGDAQEFMRDVKSVAGNLGDGFKARVRPSINAMSFRMRAWWLFVPVPFLLLALVTRTLGGHWMAVLTLLGALFGVFAGAWMVREGLAIAAKDQGRVIQPGRPPWRLGGSLVLGATAAAMSLTFSGAASGGLVQQLIAAIATGGIVAAMPILAFGVDQLAAVGLIEAARKASMPQNELIKAFNSAYAKVDKLEATAARAIDSRIGKRLTAIAQSARRVLGRIESDPKDLRRSRRFLANYLDNAAKIAQDFQAKRAQLRDSAMGSRYVALLDSIQQTFAEQEKKLDQDDHMDLDVRMEVLKTQMEREGL